MKINSLTVDFLGIGAQKAGTTWLYYQLARHPQISFPRGKELHYWDKTSIPDATEWISLLNPTEIIQSDFKYVKTGEITPAYAILSANIIRKIFDCCPQIKIFMSLRNPLERAWSSALMELERVEKRISETTDEWFLDNFYSADSRARGQYVSCINRWYSIFPSEQLLIIFLEDIAIRPAYVLSKLATHIGIDTLYFERLNTSDLAKVIVPCIREGIESPNPPPIRDSLLTSLISLYREEIMLLEKLLNRNLSHWLEYKPQNTQTKQRITSSLNAVNNPKLPRKQNRQL